MDVVFDISQDELPIFLAETDEHLQILDEGLVRLEHNENDPELLHELFRAAHTLKGIAGMIGHKRMVDLTHKIEAAFDAVRKNEMEITTPLIDLCLEGVDGLRSLRNEVTEGQASNFDVDGIVANFTILLENSQNKKQSAHDPVQNMVPRSISADDKDRTLLISADILQTSVASAARAFQLMMALQEHGTILEMEPTQEWIESAAPVHQFKARLQSSHSLEEISMSLNQISEIENLKIEATSAAILASEQHMPVEAKKPIIEIDRLGEFLVKKGYIKQTQLDSALAYQKAHPGEGKILGQVLSQMGWIDQSRMDEALRELIEQQRITIQNIQSSAEKGGKEKQGDKTVRTSVERLDNLMNLVGELITDRNRLYQTRNNLDTRFRGDEQISSLVDTVTHIGRITDQLQEEVMRIRMLPISNVFSKFPRMVRDLSQKSGKDIDLIVRGEDTELDRSVIEEINDPLIHLIRNCVDHGIEKPGERIAAGKPPRGTIKLTAHHEQGRIVITVEDDGQGIDTGKLRKAAVQKGFMTESEAQALPEEKAINLIFQSGLSTARVVSDISGRGVGMDIVRNNLERINGSIQVETALGKGTQFQIILPLTLAIVPTLLVRVIENTFAIPLAAVTETRRTSQKEIQTVRGRPVIMLRDRVLTLLSLAEIYGLPVRQEAEAFQFVVVVNSGKQQIGLMVDSLVGEEEVVVKSMGALIGDVPGVSSAAILGDGQVALIVDVPGLFKLSGIH